MLQGRYFFGVDVWALGLVLAEVENNGLVCPTKAGASEWDQLLEAWVMCQPVATSSPFTRKAQKRFALPLFIIGALVEGRQLVEEAACGALGLKKLAACGALGVKKQLAALGG